MKTAALSSFIRNAILILIGIISLNTLYIFNFYIVKNGDLDFFNFGDHVFGNLNALLAFLATLLAWKISTGSRYFNGYRLLFAFFMSFLIFSFFTSIYFSAVRTYHDLFIDANQLFGNIVFSFSLSFVPISGLTLAFLYFRNARTMTLEKQKMQTQLLSKNLEPHFLFNNLSILSSMMRNRKDDAEVFLDSLSEVYRYFLKHNASDKVSLQDELKFIKEYIHLIVSRFDIAYQVRVKVEDQKGELIPFVLHTCIENAIKHNKATDSNPLIIEIERIDNRLQIKNDYRPQKSSFANGQGLENIAKRYELIFGEKINVAITNDKFIVEVPIL